MTADLTDAIRDEYRRLSARVVEYLTGQGWELRPDPWTDDVTLIRPSANAPQDYSRIYLYAGGLEIWNSIKGVTHYAEVSSAQQAVDYLVVAAILPESMASWAPLVGEAQQIGEGGPDDPSAKGCGTCALHHDSCCIAAGVPLPLASPVTHCPLWTERS